MIPKVKDIIPNFKGQPKKVEPKVEYREENTNPFNLNLEGQPLKDEVSFGRKK
jgi:hypothetical protein